ncbi:ABC transporter substrate-binding protein [Poseidonibacter ostreae]|uniref:ABC transporter substrate-binding protein n=1 Tax=Poseidonibacter ostreae TaxID=2654171 RepID=A0A6L4WUD2_9BACT|nr:ABC transporter substrate-binding protein [Poseidonibacter ostreae]KAB7888380.1 ABC transporter substrate-binding protein [Poseidonibacter ostreae]KAB7889840.1 ABC transporter substrate-binding protein [Poseidonibacter ostreae]
MKNIFITMLIFIFFVGCFEKNENDTIKIGVVLGLSGKYSDLGLNEKNGIILAFDKINYQINGKKIELILKDDKQDKEVNKQVINELIEDNVKYIIANATSSMSKISSEIISKHKDIFQISPTASSSYFSKKDDNFFRVQTANSIEHFSNLIKLLEDSKAKNIYLIGDVNNKAYLYDYLHLFDDKEMKYKELIDSNLAYEDILEKVKDADFIVQVQNGIDAAGLIQYLRINNNTTPIISSGWAKNEEFIENVGKWAEGVYFTSSNYINYENKDYQDFAKDFYSIYKYQSNRSNIQGFQAANIIIEALQNGHKKVDDIKKYIIEKETFNIAGDEISFDKYGDIKTPYYIFRVKNSKFIKIK